LHFSRTGLLPAISGVESGVGVTKETVKVFSFLASQISKALALPLVQTIAG